MNLQDSARKSALLVIDVQNDFCPGGSLEVKDGDLVVRAINKVAPLFPFVVATKDWHPVDHVSFASNHQGKQPLDRVVHKGEEQILWPDHCVQDTVGSDLHAGLDTKPLTLILHKGYKPGLDSYSAFFENDRTTSTGLEYLLRGLGYSTVFVCGLATDVCVFYSVNDALRLGFEVHIITDGCRGVDIPAGSVDRALASMQEAGAKPISSDDFGL